MASGRPLSIYHSPNPIAHKASRHCQTKHQSDQVRDAWTDVFSKRGVATLRGPVDKLGLFRPLFARADEIAESGSGSQADNEKVIREALSDMGALP